MLQYTYAYPLRGLYLPRCSLGRLWPREHSENFLSQERTEALVLRGVDYSETSRIVTFLTPDRGRLACMAKGARRPKSAFSGLLETMNRLEIVYTWKENRSVQLLTDATLLDSFDAITGDLDRGMYASFPIEVAYKASHENQPSELMYERLVSDLSAFTRWNGPVDTFSAWQALRILSVAGFAPTWQRCCSCGVEIGERVGFSYAGGLVCPSCPSDSRMSAADRTAFRSLMESVESCPEVRVSAGLFTDIVVYAKGHLESDIRSARVIRQMYGTPQRSMAKKS